MPRSVVWPIRGKSFGAGGPLVTPLAFAVKTGYIEKDKRYVSCAIGEKDVSPTERSVTSIEHRRTEDVRTPQPFVDDASRSRDPCQRSVGGGRRPHLCRCCSVGRAHMRRCRRASHLPLQYGRTPCAGDSLRRWSSHPLHSGRV